ncbi:nephrocystin-4-like isoform X2 [Lytechinus variegatus]|uniref:nephrocystin-4-like isoform X2 n=1 Tax=Lytechinus variegatus TaxID=7654 RepID=UPI001BB15EEA|nr:nephrocystin-4-like isoform X2 [Lytechinus variegatus]
MKDHESEEESLHATGIHPGQTTKHKESSTWTPSTLIPPQPPQLLLTPESTLALWQTTPNVWIDQSKPINQSSHRYPQRATSFSQFSSLPRHFRLSEAAPLTQHQQTWDEIESIKQEVLVKRVIPADYRRTAVRYHGDETVDRKNWVPFFILVHSVDNVAHDVEAQEKAKKQTQYQLRFSLFDITFKRFFGRTLVGPKKVCKQSASHAPRLQYNLPVYFHTSLADPNIVLIVEIIALINDAKTGPRQMSCGWCVLRLFQQGDIPDTSQSTPAPVRRADVYHGSPRALLYLEDDDIEGNPNITFVSDCQLCFTIKTHRYLEKIFHLLPENILALGTDIIPGVTIVDANSGGDSLRKPKPLKKVSCSIDKVQVTLHPNVEKFEDDLCKLINSDRTLREEVTSDKGVVQVAERRLHVGIHNGWGYVDSPQIMMLDADTLSRGGSRGSKRMGKKGISGSRESLQGTSVLHVKGSIKLSEVVNDPLFSLVFMMEYIVTIPNSMSDKKLNSSMNRHQTRNIAVRWAAWCPKFQDSLSEVNLTFTGGPVPNPDGILFYKCDEPSSNEMNKMVAGKLKFVFKIKKEESRRPLSPQSTSVPSEAPRLHRPSDLRPNSRGQYPSMQSLPSQTSGTEASMMNELPPSVMGKPPIPRSPRLPVGASHSNFNHLQPHSTAPDRGPATQQYLMPQMYATGPSTQPYMGPPGMRGQYPPIQAQPMTARAPFEIMHMEAPAGEPADEIPFTPVHAPVITTGPVQQGGSGLSRAAYARLFQAGFPEITDRRGEAPEVVDPNDHTRLNPQREINDPLQSNEIVIQFLAMSRILSFEVNQKSMPKTVFFTFQFYRYPPVTTERLLLGEIEGKLSADPQSLPFILKRLKKDGEEPDDGPPGWMVRYNVDPSFLKPGEARLFLHYLEKQTFHIDVWDGDSLLLLGSLAVDLKHLLRGGREAVQVTHEVDILTTEHSDEDYVLTGDIQRGGSIRPVGSRNVTRGRLHLRLANVGQEVDAKVIKATTLPLQDTKVIVQEDGSGAFLGGSLHAGTKQTNASLASLKQKRSYLASHMAEADQELATALFSRRDKTTVALKESNREGDHVKQRKLARMEALRQAHGRENNGLTNTLVMKKEEKTQRIRDLKTIELYRERSKKEGIMNMLQSVITTEHTINPAFGRAEFFEFVLKNPYNAAHTISIQWEHSSLSVITNPNEWRHFKTFYEIYNTPVEEGLFDVSQGGSSTGKGDVPGVKVFLRPKEEVNIPFKFQTFEADESITSNTPYVGPRSQFQLRGKDNKINSSLESQLIKVYFKTQDNKSIAVLSLNVDPQPHVIDQTFRLQQPEHSFLRKSIRLPMFNQSSGATSVTSIYVKCSDSNVICDTKNTRPGEPYEIFIKAACGASPAIKKFYLLIYSSQYLARPLQTWEFYIHTLQRVDVTCVEGQTAHITLVLKGASSTRHVQCFTSHPDEIKVAPGDPFMLLSNSVHELNLGVRPRVKGNKFMFINVVDIEYHVLVRSWLVSVICRAPYITKSFELQLPVGGGKGSNKRISYTNRYPQRRVFFIRCNRDDLLQFKETRIEIGGGEACPLGLRFAPCHQPGTAEILIFINNEDDKNEETFQVTAIYS